jgi:hypothetical protein
MSQQITTAMVQGYRAGVEWLVQQQKSRFRDCVRVESGLVGKAHYFDQIGIRVAQKTQTRHGDTVITDTPHGRRRLNLVSYDDADLIDQQDQLRCLTDFSNPYSEASGKALNRAIDDEIIGAAFGTAYTGEDGSVGVPFDATMTVAAAASGLTVAKMIAAKEMLAKNENDEDETWYMACSAVQVSNLLNDAKATSTDFVEVQALMEGKITKYMGFVFIRTERLPKVATERRCPFWRKSGLLLGIARDIVTDVGPRRDKRNATQVYAAMDLGATRMQEKSVGEVLCTEP